MGRAAVAPSPDAPVVLLEGHAARTYGAFSVIGFQAEALTAQTRRRKKAPSCARTRPPTRQAELRMLRVVGSSIYGWGEWLPDIADLGRYIMLLFVIVCVTCS